MKDRFVLYTSYADAILSMTDEQAGILLKAIYRYVTTGEQEEITDSTARFAYKLIVSQIEQSDKQYKQKCEKLRANIQKRWNTDVNNSNATNTNESDSLQMNTNVYDCIQKNTTEYDCIHINKELNKRNKEREEEDKKKAEPSICAEAQSSSFDYSSIVEYWNEAVQRSGSAMRTLRGLTENRKAAIRARLREHKKEGVEAIRQMIDKAVTSDFLNGKNSRNNIFTFDRLMSPSMFQKTLEGNFDNAPATANEPPQSHIGQLIDEQQAEQKTRAQEQRERFEQMIEAVRQNPNHRCKSVLFEAAKNGTLKKLGITLSPDIFEN